MAQPVKGSPAVGSTIEQDRPTVEIVDGRPIAYFKVPCRPTNGVVSGGYGSTGLFLVLTQSHFHDSAFMAVLRETYPGVDLIEQKSMPPCNGTVIRNG